MEALGGFKATVRRQGIAVLPGFPHGFIHEGCDSVIVMAGNKLRERSRVELAARGL